MSEKKWHRANTALLVAIILINGYIIALPILPGLSYWWQNRGGSAEKVLTKRLSKPSSTPDDKTTPDEFHADASRDGLIIPKMLLETPLVEGPKRDSFNLLNKGAWRLPFASSPDKGGNTVIAGHRFSYTGPRGIFYFLNKLQVGDQIGLWYHGTLYTYAVSSSTTHAPTDIYVQEPTPDARLTLYTCTPLWNPTERLVVVAKPLPVENPATITDQLTTDEVKPTGVTP
ncbi:MAG: class E sortase [Candidatus Saccharimonadales bacterium]|nr:class E sortase [Candidatus Saccharibacteria bacterium]